MHMAPDCLIDCHIHLQDAAFDADREAVIRRARDAGVQRFLCNGTHPRDWPLVKDLARAYECVFPCFGLHPWYVTTYRQGPWLETLGDLLERVPSAVGEIGLDRWIKNYDIDAQCQAFRRQLALARDLQRPAMIHCLRAWGLLMDELRGFGHFPAGLVIHGFGGSADLVKPLIDLGGWFSFAGNILDERKTRAQRALCAVPWDRLLVETDAPDMAPPPAYRIGPSRDPDTNKSYRNEPANLPGIIEGIARLRKVAPEALQQAVWENSRQLLKGLM